MTFGAMVGQSEAKAQLRRMLAAGPGHAVLFTGPEGSGRRLLASLFGQALLCLSPGEDGACGTCRSCRLFEAGSHPDWIAPLRDPKREKTGIPVERIRRDVVGPLALFPQESPRKVLLLPGDELNETSQNVLLKSIEEPPPYAVFLMTVASPRNLRPTLVSRMVRVRLAPLSDDDMRRFLSGRGIGLPDGFAPALLRMARGIPGEALRLLASSDLPDRRVALLDLLESLGGMTHAELFDTAWPALDALGEELPWGLAMWSGWIHDMILMSRLADPAAAAREPARRQPDGIGSLAHPDRQSAYRKRVGAAADPAEGLGRCLAAVDESARALESGANREMTVCSLLLQLRKELSHAQGRQRPVS